MKNALILHGTGNDSSGNWFPWLKEKMEEMGYKVWVPDLPESNKPDLERYWNFIKDFDFNNETVLIGHSSGAGMVFGILQKLPIDKKIKLAISVAGFYKDEGWNCQGLFSQIFDWEKIKKQAKNIKIIWSPTDPYISREQTDYLAKQLNINPTIIEKKGHFNLEGGNNFKQFPELIEVIKKILVL